MPSVPKTVLLVGVSVRILAQSARRAGIHPVSLDWFADTDTTECSLICRAVADGAGFDVDRLLWAAERYAPAGVGTAFVYGGGFDGNPALLSRLAKGRILAGNLPETVTRLKSPHDFFRELDRLGIPHPEVRWTLGAEHRERETWLIKLASSEGGTGVHPAPMNTPGTHPRPGISYFQQRRPGTACSALFLANGKDTAIIGFNALWTSDHCPRQPYLFAGARTDTALGDRQRKEVREYVNALTRAFSLRGINSVDFLVDADHITVLEINPRPSATVALYDADYADGLLLRHIDACLEKPLGPVCSPRSMRAFKILYNTGSELEVPADIRWPAWCSDRPSAGTWIARGRPVCSVLAECYDGSTLEKQLFARERAIRSLLMF